MTEVKKPDGEGTEGGQSDPADEENLEAQVALGVHNVASTHCDHGGPQVL